MDAAAEGNNPRLYRIRHSLAHVLAQAVVALRPGTTLGFGPPIEDGFYYDFVLSSPLTEEDFPAIESAMRKIIGGGQVFVREDLPVEAAYERLTAMGEPHKLEYARELVTKQELSSLSFYTNGAFVDMCEGPHVERSNQLPADAFKLRAMSGAYWRGDQRNAQMTRIYAWAFENKAQLEARIAQHKAALERDHKKLGKELNLFVVDEVIGKGLPLWLPDGSVIRDELQRLMTELEFKGGYQRVHTPHLAREEMYFQTGHLPYYAPHMYPAMELKETDEEGAEVVRERYRLRPMNCPHHHRIFAARPRSYRDLPMRLAEYGHVYRFEDSGALSGMLRVRGMCMNDGHIYCTPEQVRAEFIAVIDLHREAYRVLGLDQYSMRFSTWDPEDPKGKAKFIDDPVAWEDSQRQVREAMDELGLSYKEVKGEAAFYGPNRLPVQECDGPRGDGLDRPARLRNPRPCGAHLPRQRQPGTCALRDSPRAARDARALCRLPDRALRGRLPDVAGAGTGRRHHGVRSLRRSGARLGCGPAQQLRPSRTRHERRVDGSQDS